MMSTNSIQWVLFNLVLMLCACSIVKSGDILRTSYARLFESCSLAEDSDRIAMDSATDCKYACLGKLGSGGCAAYQWDVATSTCRRQHTLNLTASSPGDNVGVMLDTDMVVGCFNDTDCAPDYTCHGLSTGCGWLQSSCVAADCTAIQNADPDSRSGVYDILAYTLQVHKVWCDMDTDGGGWTVFLKRLDGSVDFYRDFAAYQQGFGNVSGEHWLGLDALHAVTSAKKYELRADISSWNSGESAFSTYASMVVSSGTNYTLTVGEFTGGLAGDPMKHSNNSRFSAMDFDQDAAASYSCAQRHHGGFWYRTCQMANPTGKYYTGGDYVSGNNDGMQWKTWDIDVADTSFYSMKTLDMKIRP